MNIINKILKFIKKLLKKEKKIKQLLDEPKSPINNEQKDNFYRYIHVDIIPKESKKEIKTLICNGSGLGIYNEIKY